MKVVKEELLTPMVRLPDGLVVPYGRRMDRPYKPTPIDHYRSTLRVEIEGREAQVEALTQPEMLQLGRQLVEEQIRREMREGILALVGRELFGQRAPR